MKLKKLLLIVLIISFSNYSYASWFSEISGIDIDLNRGNISIKPPNIAAIPEMIKNLPKDISQAMLNPTSPILASAIRFSRGQALNRGVNPIPPQIRQKLSPYFPAQILDKVRWTTANGISLDGALKNWFNQEGAITYDEVIVFAGTDLTTNTELWAHELTHVLQYAQLGIETFAFQYSFNWNQMESQAKDNASRVIASINSTNIGKAQTWSYDLQPIALEQPLSWGSINQAAMIEIPPQQCIWINNQWNTTGNNCPVPILVTGLVIRRLHDGFTFTYPCNEPTCLFGANQSGPLISPVGHAVVGITAAYKWQ